MTNQIKYVCVYSSSSDSLPEIYYKEAQLLGELMGKSGFNLIYGGSTLGTMGINAKAVKENGGKVIAVIPEKLHRICEQYEQCDNIYITKEMRERKAKMDELSDAVIALAGGFGTLEEISEMIVQKQLGYTDKAIIILNTNNFYNHLLNFFENMIGQNFANTDMHEACFIAQNPHEVINYLKNYKPKHFEVDKKLNLSEK